MEQRKPMLSPIVGLKGTVIGIANMVPGVSGGTIAVLLGIYDELMEAFGAFFSSAGGWRRNLLFLFPVVLGVVIGTIGFARIIGFLLDNYPLQTNLFFIGLIVGSLPHLVQHIDRSVVRHKPVLCVGLFVVGAASVLAMGLADPPSATEPMTDTSLQTLLIILLAALVSSFALAIPGLSGSFILLLLGLYTTMQTAFSSLNWILISVFILGNLIGIAMIARAIHWLLRRYHTLTYAVIIGLVLGSIASLWQPLPLDGVGATAVAAGAAGIVAAWLLGSRQTGDDCGG